MLEESEIVDKAQPEQKIVDKSEPESEPEVVDELDPEPEVEEYLIEIPVDLLAEPIMKLLQSSPAMRVLLSLRPPDVYNLLQVFLNEAGSQEFGVLVCSSIFSRADLSCSAAFISLELPLNVISLSRKWFHLHHHSSSMMHH